MARLGRGGPNGTRIGTVGQLLDAAGDSGEHALCQLIADAPHLMGVEVYVNRRFGARTLGRAHQVAATAHQWIELNPAVQTGLLSRGNFAMHAAAIDTLTHEIAHLWAGIVAAHGPLWVQRHRQLGGTGERLAATSKADALCMPASKRRERKVVAVCDRCAAQVHRARALPRGKVFTHKRCGGTVRATGN